MFSSSLSIWLHTNFFQINDMATLLEANAPCVNGHYAFFSQDLYKNFEAPAWIVFGILLVYRISGQIFWPDQILNNILFNEFVLNSHVSRLIRIKTRILRALFLNSRCFSSESMTLLISVPKSVFMLIAIYFLLF